MTRLAADGGSAPSSPPQLPPPDHLSWSQISRLSTAYPRACPRQWAYGRLLGLLPSSTDGTGRKIGRILDDAVAVMFVTRLDAATDGEAIVLADMLRTAEDGIETAEFPADKAEAYAGLVLAAIEVLYEALLAVRPATVQETHDFYVHRLTGGEPIKVVGRSDWVTVDGVIVDLKWTGRKPWTADGEWDEGWLTEKRDQTALYWLGRQAAAQRAELPAPPPRARILVVSGMVPRPHKDGTRGKASVSMNSYDFTFTADDRLRMIERVREADAAQHAPTHPALPGEHCQFCDYLAICRTDQARTACATSALGVNMPRRDDH